MTSSVLSFPVAPLAPQKKTINYGPAPKALVRAVREELRRLIELPDLDANLGMIARFAHQADDMLMCVKSPEAVMRDEHATLVPGVLQSPSNAETYGATIMRQLIPALQSMGSQQTPGQMVAAIADARRLGMTDVAAELEKKLTGKALDGERPIADPLKELRNHYLGDMPELPPAPKSKTKKKKATT